MTRIWNTYGKSPLDNAKGSNTVLSNTGLKSRNRKVFVGLSGGVDSSVSAALLKKEGYEVTGVFIKVWQPDWISCTWKDERREAMRAAAHIGIPFYTLDLTEEYKRDVIDYMIREYGAGRTPNPDVMCNRYVKFGAFWKWAKEKGADCIATGHYARVQSSSSNATESSGEGKTEYMLLAGTDKNKDQSYFLWTLTQDDLEHTLFPVGHLEKSEVRRLAGKFGLPNAKKKDSQGLCFIGKVDVKEFLSHYIETKPGKVLDDKGKGIGIHPGSLLFTIGERHGFTITEKTPHDSPYYVIGKDTDRNILIVSNRDADNSLAGSNRTVKISGVNWIKGKVPSVSGGNAKFPFLARARYRQALSNVRISETGKVEFERPQETLTPGQSLVIYDGEVCLGGGVIESNVQ